MDYELAIKNVNQVLVFTEKPWLKLCTYLIYSGKPIAKNSFGKKLFAFDEESILWKRYEKCEKAGINLQKYYKELEPNCHKTESLRKSKKCPLENILSLKMTKTKLTMKKTKSVDYKI